MIPEKDETRENAKRVIGRWVSSVALYLCITVSIYWKFDSNLISDTLR